MSAIKLAFDAILEKKGRSFLTMLGIIIGVAAVLILVGLVSGYNADITAYYEKLGVNKITVDITYYDRTNTVDITDDLIAFIGDDLADAVIGITPESTSTGTLKYMANSNSTATVYFGNEQWSACNNYVIDRGRDLLPIDAAQRSRVCVIGTYVAESLFGYINPVGKTITFGGEPFLVVGTYYQKDGTAEDSMDDMIVIPYTHIRALKNTATVTKFTVKVQNADLMETVMAELEYFLGDTLSTNTSSYTLENGNDAMTESDEETASISIVLGGVACIALLVGGIGIMNIMLVTVTERTREIGIKKAIGAQRSVIITQFLVESSVLSAAGGVIGIVIGYAGSLILGKIIYDLILVPDTLVTVGAALFSVVIGVVFGLYPAVKASGLQPVDALRAD
ncbi:MAG: ABC transporter permease [Clostridia bacterium]|nr:ABC transporter permease [Clostridia bacterium]